MEEFIPHYNKEGHRIGTILRLHAHDGSKKLHPVVHIHIFSSLGELLLQKRSTKKSIQPGKWDSAVGGHLTMMDTAITGGLREMEEEIGVKAKTLPKPFTYIWESEIEREYVYLFKMRYDGPFEKEEGEIDELRFWTKEQLEEAMGTGILTPNLEYEISQGWIFR